MFAHEPPGNAVAVHLLFDEDYDAWRTTQPQATQTWLAQTLFRPERHRLALIPEASGRIQAVVLGLGKRSGLLEPTLWHIAGLPERLPAGRYRIATAMTVAAHTQCAIGWGYGQYRFERYK